MGHGVVVRTCRGEDPVRIGIMALLISRPRPVPNLLAYWLGLMASGFGVAMAVLILLRDSALMVIHNVESTVEECEVHGRNLHGGVFRSPLVCSRCCLQWAFERVRGHRYGYGVAMRRPWRCSPAHRPHSPGCQPAPRACWSAALFGHRS